MFVCTCKHSKPCTVMIRRSVAKYVIPMTNHKLSVSVGLCWEYRRQIAPLGKECIDSFDMSSEVCLRIRFTKKAYSGSESLFAASNVF